MSYSTYLAGPMSNIPEFNFPLFAQAAKYLRECVGWEVKSPAEKDLEIIPEAEMKLIPGYATGDLATYSANCSFEMSNAMAWDLPAILNSNAITLLPDWEKSTGARWERVVAEALDRDIWLLTPTSYSLVTLTCDGWRLELDDEPKRLTTYLRGFGELSNA